MTKQIDASTKKIKSQRDYLNVLMKQLSSGLISISESGECLSANSAIFTILGVEGKHIINKRINKISIGEKSIEALLKYI